MAFLFESPQKLLNGLGDVLVDVEEVVCHVSGIFGHRLVFVWVVHLIGLDQVPAVLYVDDLVALTVNYQ